MRAAGEGSQSTPSPAEREKDGMRVAGEGQAEGGTPLRVLLYRYFFFDWLFRDASRGTTMERASALRFNRQMSHHLLTYLRRWVGVVVGSCALGAGFEKALLLTYTRSVWLG